MWDGLCALVALPETGRFRGIGFRGCRSRRSFAARAGRRLPPAQRECADRGGRSGGERGPTCRNGSHSQGSSSTSLPGRTRSRGWRQSYSMSGAGFAKLCARHGIPTQSRPATHAVPHVLSQLVHPIRVLLLDGVEHVVTDLLLHIDDLLRPARDGGRN